MQQPYTIKTSSKSVNYTNGNSTSQVSHLAHIKTLPDNGTSSLLDSSENEEDNEYNKLLAEQGTNGQFDMSVISRVLTDNNLRQLAGETFDCLFSFGPNTPFVRYYNLETVDRKDIFFILNRDGNILHPTNLSPEDYNDNDNSKTICFFHIIGDGYSSRQLKKIVNLVRARTSVNINFDYVLSQASKGHLREATSALLYCDGLKNNRQYLAGHIQLYIFPPSSPQPQ
jgi:hypothetical protein